MGVLVILGGDHWYELHPAAYAKAAFALVRAHPNVRELEVWNEPDLCSLAVGWVTCLPTGHRRFAGSALDAYLDELAATHDALVGTGVKVLGFGFSPPWHHANRGLSFWDPQGVADGIDSWYARRGGRKCVGMEGGECISVRGVRYARPIMDGFAYHPYAGWEVDESELIHDSLASINMPGGTPPLWWTEVGMNTALDYPATPWHGTETAQATRVEAVLGAAKASPWVAGVFNFLLTDDANPKGWASGLLRADGSVKPAFAAFEART